MRPLLVGRGPAPGYTTLNCTYPEESACPWLWAWIPASCNTADGGCPVLIRMAVEADAWSGDPLYVPLAAGGRPILYVRDAEQAFHVLAPWCPTRGKRR